ncbi:MAG: hypothetical protein ABL879_10950 [Devosia sp.]
MVRHIALSSLAVLALTGGSVAAGFIDGDPDREAATLAAIKANKVYSDAFNYREVVSAPDQAHQVPLTIVVLKGSGWNDAAILDEIATAEDTYRPCAISFDPIVVVEAETTYDLDKIGRKADAELTQEWANEFAPIDRKMALLDLPRPLVIFRKMGGAYSYNASLMNGPFYEPLRDTIFVPIDAIENQRDTLTTAHELGHVLLNEDHNEVQGNILGCNDEGCLGSKVSKRQCKEALAWWQQWVAGKQ